MCLSVCPALLVNKIPAKQMHQFGRGFRKTVAYCIDSDPIEIGELRSKLKVTVTQYSSFLHNYLFTLLLYISFLLCLIELKFGMLLRYALYRFVVEFHKNQMGDDVMATSFKFSLYKCPYFKFY